jgi:phosphoenolpyruvate synthase/pyruvate phosphate dikinase/rhodanese-related sulfurtransferase
MRANVPVNKGAVRRSLIQAHSPRAPHIDRRTRWTRSLGTGIGWAAVLLFLVDGTAWAIPSPDVMISLFASAAQVLALLSVVLGKWFFSRRSSPTAKSGAAFRIPFYVAAGLCLASTVGWFLYSAQVRDANTRRLEVNLSRDSKENGRKIVDVTLKELPYGEQTKRQDGITTQSLSEMISGELKLAILDIRESEEFEVGRIAKTQHVRFPDLMSNPDDFIAKGKPVVLLCFNGNRSSELCSYLQPLGYDTRFVIGGFEKWVAEDRPLEGAEGRTVDELRQVPDYPNKNTLLDTPDVMALLEQRPDILFVDVRYPREFEDLGHLPGAVNLTLRKMTTPELEKALGELPRRPIIVPCYDKRSSFFALILGLRASRRGYEFLGRYTVPESFSLPGKDKPHVAAWKAAHAERTLVSVAAEPLKGSLGWLQADLGSLALAIFALVVLIRLALLPWTMKADRDRFVQQRIEPELAELKARHAGDPRLIARATAKLLRSNRIRPVVSLIGTVALLVVFTIFFSVVDQASRGSEEKFLWMKTLGEADPARILPIVVAALAAAMVATGGAEVTRKRLVAAALVGVLTCAIVWRLRAGVNLYLIANLALLSVQTQLVKHWLAARSLPRRHARAVRRYANAAVVPLAQAHIATACGNKAARLGRMIEAKLPVPSGFVVATRAIEEWQQTHFWPVATRRAIQREHARFAHGPVAVRSSGLNEDGSDKSYAGVFESILNVRADGLFDALEKVARSLSSERAQAYSKNSDEAGCIVVQEMVSAEWAGVLFTEHPDESGAALVELVQGLGEELVSGRAQPMSLRLGRFTGHVLENPRAISGNKTAPIDLRPLFDLGRKVEALFGRPQDIEWAYAGGKFYLLQARDITRFSRQGADGHALREHERRRLLEIARASAAHESVLRASADQPVFSENELSELLPQPTPFSLAWMDRLWAYGGSTHRACQALGIPYDVEPSSPPYVVSAFGALRVNELEGARRLAKAPGTVTSFRLTRAADEIERAYRDEFLPVFSKQIRMREVVDLARLTQKELVELFKDTAREFVERDYLQAEIVNVAADFYFKTAVRALEKRGLDPAEHLAHLPPTVVNEAMELLAAVGRGDAEISAFLKIFGHRSPQDYELGQPRYCENIELVEAMAKRSSGAARRVHEAPKLPERRVLALAVERARRYQALKEEAKHHALRALALVRKLLLELGRRLEVGDGIFQLTPDEIARLDEPGFRRTEALELIRARQEYAEALASVRLSSAITLCELEALDVEHGEATIVPQAAGALRGTRVSGRGEVSGRARVMRSSDEIDSFRKGEVLVARFTDPSWTPVFPLAGGIVTEVGGWLSHAAIQARECDINAIVGARGAMDSIETGDLVCLHADGTIERFGDRRTENRIAVRAQVLVNREQEIVNAHIGDFSHRGALLLVAGHTLEVGEDVELCSPDSPGVFAATVVRNGTPGMYGIMFRERIDRALAEVLCAQVSEVPTRAKSA